MGAVSPPMPPWLGLRPRLGFLSLLKVSIYYLKNGKKLEDQTQFEVSIATYNCCIFKAQTNLYTIFLYQSGDKHGEHKHYSELILINDVFSNSKIVMKK